MTERIDEIKAEIKPLSIAEQEQRLIAYFNEAIEAKEFALAEKIALLIVGEEQGQPYRVHLRLFCLEYLLSRLVNGKDDSPLAKFLYHDKLMHILWRFKWVVAVLPRDFSISREEIEANIAKMKDFYEQLGGISSVPVYKVGMLQAILMGDEAKAKEYYHLWQDSPKDEEMEDCPACELSDHVYYLYFIKDYEKAVEMAVPLMNGELSCGEVPHITYSSVIFSLIELGRIQEAKKLLPKAIAAVNEQSLCILNQIPLLMEAAARLKEYEYLNEMIDRYQETIIDASDEYDILRLFFALSLFDEETAEKTREFAKVCDERNGNLYHQQYLSALTRKDLQGQDIKLS
ncbi:hypothetical protein [Basilea psittacipulmonis]|uniref:Tetratricopeptide repeat protein n=1 Tax=Basilea psittacipulmonis DSM 24701 TaxID=1072685 RepID=A0A077DC14_9BURK|nr:hypothetical protein [Basilea psittacipulmonis]AIL32194.1 hypothetical protein IX83_01690 [Basilea psittacipulmonis DSM 24701]